MDKLSERMRKNKVDITWSVSRTLATIDMWADKVAQLEAENATYKGMPVIVAGMVICPHCKNEFFMPAKHLEAGGE